MDMERRKLKVEFYKSRGPGGQHKNKRFTAVRITHLPTGLMAVAQGERSQAQNKGMALARLKVKLAEKFKVRRLRIPTGKTRAARERILGWKKKRSLIKKARMEKSWPE